MGAVTSTHRSRWFFAAHLQGALGTGATTTIGFVGNYTGPNVLPSVFTFNGRVCGTG